MGAPFYDNCSSADQHAEHLENENCSHGISMADECVDCLILGEDEMTFSEIVVAKH